MKFQTPDTAKIRPQGELMRISVIEAIKSMPNGEFTIPEIARKLKVFPGSISTIIFNLLGTKEVQFLGSKQNSSGTGKGSKVDMYRWVSLNVDVQKFPEPTIKDPAQIKNKIERLLQM